MYTIIITIALTLEVYFIYTMHTACTYVRTCIHTYVDQTLHTMLNHGTVSHTHVCTHFVHCTYCYTLSSDTMHMYRVYVCVDLANTSIYQ